MSDSIEFLPVEVEILDEKGGTSKKYSLSSLRDIRDLTQEIVRLCRSRNPSCVVNVSYAKDGVTVYVSFAIRNAESDEEARSKFEKLLTQIFAPKSE